MNFARVTLTPPELRLVIHITAVAAAHRLTDAFKPDRDYSEFTEETWRTLERLQKKLLDAELST